MAHVNYYTLAILGKEINVSIKAIVCHSRYKEQNHAATNEPTRDDIMTSFPEFDCIHLNCWGNHVMIHDIAQSIVGNWGSKVDGGSYSEESPNIDQNSSLTHQRVIREHWMCMNGWVDSHFHLMLLKALSRSTKM